MQYLALVFPLSSAISIVADRDTSATFFFAGAADTSKLFHGSPLPVAVLPSVSFPLQIS